MTDSPRIFAAGNRLLQHYQTLRCGDVICGKLPLKPGEEQLLVDLISRGITMIPSATAQLASRSKTFQARLFGPWMVAETHAVYDLHHLLELTNRYTGLGIDEVVLKQEGKNAGIGVLRYRGIEDVYTQAATSMLTFPFVIQPFVADCHDMRVLLLGDYVEAYRRRNPGNFRNNLHWGGISEAIDLPAEARRICLEVMKRGQFPYGHFDLLQTNAGQVYLAEVNLHGGIKGAKLSREEYCTKVRELENVLLAELGLEQAQPFRPGIQEG